MNDLNEIYMLVERRDVVFGDDDSLDNWDNIGVHGDIDKIKEWVSKYPDERRYFELSVVDL